MNACDLIFGLMSALDLREVGAARLKDLLRPFGVTETGLRTALSRMTAGKVLRVRRSGKAAFYALAPRGERIKRNVSLALASPDWSGWDGAWWGVIFSVPEGRKENRYRIRKKLSAYRFAPLQPGFWIRPFHPRERLDRHLADLSCASETRMIRFQPVDPIPRDTAAGIWRLKDINRMFSEGLRRLSASLDGIRRSSPSRALVMRMTVGDEMVKMLSQDPLLPGFFLPDDWKGEELRRAFLAWDKKMDQASRPFWRTILDGREKRRRR